MNLNFVDFEEFVSTSLPHIADVVRSSYVKSHVSDEVTLSDALRELSVCNPRVYALLLDVYMFSSSLKEDSMLY
ncbi:hypothetical protein [Dipodfec virus UA23Rod_1363]|uniref:Uncharacterized protein n=1 Tax=Dipodfec virus UA23Rod_1363 TaxID=2929331 RepID=A0A976N2A0_9VIRU|nr:hypothetical protein [Dipodfec virus UA23Rod_1363]